MVSTTAPPWSAFSRSHNGLESFLTQISRLAQPEHRHDAARDVASWLGARELILFIPDIELGTPLPAPGFPQTLPSGRQWRAFLRESERHGYHRGELPDLETGKPTPAAALSCPGGVSCVLLGAALPREDISLLAALLPLLAAAGRGDQAALVSAGHAKVAQQEAARATALAKSLDVARRELQHASRAKDEFLAMLAHELRNPLAPIRNATRVIRDNPSPEAAARACEILERQVAHLTSLVNDLLDISRISHRRIELRPAPMDVTQAMQQAAEAVGPTMAERSHTLTVLLPGEPLTVDADPVRLEQVLVNLLNNAAKYTEPGGEILFEGKRDEGEVVLRVQDNGIGIAPEFLPRLFDLFAQADHSLARSQGGLGIGLTLVRHLVEMHGGNVGARSEGPGRGSEFLVRLPLRPGVVAPAQVDLAEVAPSLPPSSKPGPASGEEMAEPSPRGRRVLIVDDNEDAAKTQGDIVALWGHEFQIAHDGAAALALAQSNPPDVVLLDIGLPVMDGYEVARRIRLALGTKIRLVALTGYGQPEDRSKALDAGFDHHMVKPVDLGALEQLLSLPSNQRAS